MDVIYTMAFMKNTSLFYKAGIRDFNVLNMVQKETPTRITFIRNAEALPLYKNAGFEDCGLSVIGRKQSSKLNYNFDTILVSPCRRALETYTCSNIKVDDARICELFRDYSDVKTPNEIPVRVEKAIRYLKTIHSPTVCVISHKCMILNILSRCGYDLQEFDNCQMFSIMDECLPN